MKRLFTAASYQEDQRIVWFIDRSENSASYELDELFTRREFEELRSYLQSRSLNCHMEEYLDSRQNEEALPSWNIAGKVYPLHEEGGYCLSFEVVGCIES